MSLHPKANVIQTLTQSCVVNLNKLIPECGAKALISHITEPKYQDLLENFRLTFKQTVTGAGVISCDTAKEAFKINL